MPRGQTMHLEGRVITRQHPSPPPALQPATPPWGPRESQGSETMLGVQGESARPETKYRVNGNDSDTHSRTARQQGQHRSRPKEERHLAMPAKDLKRQKRTPPPKSIPNVDDEEVRAFLDERGISEGIMSRDDDEMELTIRVEEGKWKQLVIKHYKTTGTLLFQGPTRLSSKATQLFQERDGQGGTSEHDANEIPEMQPPAGDEEKHDETRWGASHRPPPPPSPLSYTYPWEHNAGTDVGPPTHRPVHPNGGIRFGEASNPGPNSPDPAFRRVTRSNSGVLRARRKEAEELIASAIKSVHRAGKGGSSGDSDTEESETTPPPPPLPTDS